MRLKADFFDASTLTIAKRLLGKRLVRQLPEGLVAGWIVETEAYHWRGDAACHTSRSITKSNRAMFGPPGTLYVYPIHAKYCMNIVTEREGRGAAVLIRAIEPTDGSAAFKAATTFQCWETPNLSDCSQSFKYHRHHIVAG